MTFTNISILFTTISTISRSLNWFKLIFQQKNQLCRKSQCYLFGKSTLLVLAPLHLFSVILLPWKLYWKTEDMKMNSQIQNILFFIKLSLLDKLWYDVKLFTYWLKRKLLNVAGRNSNLVFIRVINIEQT